MTYPLRRLLLTSLATVAIGTSAASAQGLTEAQVNQLIKNYIADHPQEIIDSLQSWQLKEEASRITEQQEAVKALKDTAFNEPYLPIGGNPKGDVTIVEFFDYNCPACKMMFESLDTVLKADKNIKVVFVEYPIFGPVSEENAKLGLAVYKKHPDKYFDFHAGMMRNKGKADLDYALTIAKNLGMDPEMLRKEIAKPEYNEYLTKDRETAAKLKVEGTPALIIGDTLFPGALGSDELKTHVSMARDTAKKK